jgi:hypothetical protein
MRTAAVAIALLMSSAAVAQTTQTDADMDAQVQTDTGVVADTNVDAQVRADTGMASDVTSDVSATTSAHATASNMPMASGTVVQPGNANPERDARGIAVISAAATVPAGWNGVAGTAMGGPLVDPATGATIDDTNHSYPACSASVTDNCLQTYERGRRS